MAYTIGLKADRDKLLTEVRTDPLAMGYASVEDQTKKLLDMLNDPANNIGGETTSQTLTPRILLQNITPSDLADQQVDAGELNYILTFMRMSYLDENIDAFKSKIISCFKAGSASATALAGLVRQLSRAEVLFGAGAILSSADWFDARDNGVVV